MIAVEAGLVPRTVAVEEDGKDYIRQEIGLRATELQATGCIGSGGLAAEVGTGSPCETGFERMERGKEPLLEVVWRRCKFAGRCYCHSQGHSRFAGYYHSRRCRFAGHDHK